MATATAQVGARSEALQDSSAPRVATTLRDAGGARDELALLGGDSGCESSWLPTFGQQPGTSGSVLDFTAFDDGTGIALYAAGTFVQAGSETVNHVARWDGTNWSALRDGLQGYWVADLAVFDDGTGSALYAAGYYYDGSGTPSGYIARWNGSTWSGLGRGLDLPVRCLAVHDDGSGPALYAGGWFTTAGGVPAAGIARWDGSNWSALGSGVGGSASPEGTTVETLCVFDDGHGPALFVGGSFTTAGGIAANNVARWDGTAWTALGAGVALDTPHVFVNASAVFDDGTGPALYFGGGFTSAGGAPAAHVAKWNGSAWSTLGAGTNASSVDALVVHDDGFGPALYVGGSYMTSAGGSPAHGLAKWSGTHWSAVGMDAGSHVGALFAFDSGSGESLFAGGQFERAGTVWVKNVAEFRNGGWSHLGRSVNAEVNALAAYDDGTGSALYAGGDFTSADGIGANRIAKWNGTSWEPLANGVNGSVEALAVYDDGSGTALYVGGSFSNASGVTVNRIARWNGSWSRVGFGINDTIRALVAYDSPSGRVLVAAGSFTSPVSHIAQWNGISWSPLGSGLLGHVKALATFDDGSGPALYAAGGIYSAGGAPVVGIAKWDGSTWSAMGSPNWHANALTVFDDGQGPALYLGGGFDAVGGTSAHHIARWDGSQWSALGQGVDWLVNALTVFDDGTGPVLCAAGGYLDVTHGFGNRVATWDGAQWTELGQSFRGSVRALTTIDDGSGPALVAGGQFWVADGDSYLARWAPCTTSIGTPYCFGEQRCPCGNEGVGAAGCMNSLGGSGRLVAAGRASLSADTVVLSGNGMTDGSALYFQALARGSASFGDGLRCTAGSTVRLSSVVNIGGASSYPRATDAPISVRGAIASPGLRTYQVWYRNSAEFCTTSTFNLTNGVEITWSP